MGLFGLSFGKKRRRTTKRSKKGSRKPPSKLLRICKKYRVKATKKVGGKRVYKSVASLKKLCLRKARALKKKLEKAMKKRKGAKSTKRHRKHRARRDAFGEAEMEFGRRRRRMVGFGNQNVKMASQPVNKQAFYSNNGLGLEIFGKECTARGMEPQMACIQSKLKFGSRRLPMFGNPLEQPAAFGKRRRVGARAGKTSRNAAMKAFRAFYKRHCAGRRSGFGNGGNPALSASMGYEFCPNGQGGVLGFNSTGLYPSPCVGKSSSFGRRRRRSSAIGARRRRRSTGVGAHRKGAKRCYSIGVRRRRYASSVKRRRRRSTVIGAHHKRRRTSEIGRRRRRRSSAIGARRRRN